jgi:hypothetical protein
MPKMNTPRIAIIAALAALCAGMARVLKAAGVEPE